MTSNIYSVHSQPFEISISVCRYSIMFSMLSIDLRLYSFGRCPPDLVQVEGDPVAEDRVAEKMQSRARCARHSRDAARERCERSWHVGECDARGTRGARPSGRFFAVGYLTMQRDKLGDVEIRNEVQRREVVLDLVDLISFPILHSHASHMGHTPSENAIMHNAVFGPKRQISDCVCGLDQGHASCLDLLECFSMWGRWGCIRARPVDEGDGVPRYYYRDEG